MSTEIRYRFKNLKIRNLVEILRYFYLDIFLISLLIYFLIFQVLLNFSTTKKNQK
jgi:hypothetical protein